MLRPYFINEKHKITEWWSWGSATHILPADFAPSMTLSPVVLRGLPVGASCSQVCLPHAISMPQSSCDMVSFSFAPVQNAPRAGFTEKSNLGLSQNGKKV